VFLVETLRRKSVTMADIARHAGVSVTTVSHVLNRTANISPETTQRVLAVAQQLNYVQNKTLDQKALKSKTIGILVPDISNEFYSRCIQAICDAAWAHNYKPIVCGMCHDKRIETKYIKTFIKDGISGLIFFGGFLEEKYIINAAKKVPVVLGDRYLLNHSIPSVITDNSGVMRRLVAKLAKAGYTKLGFITEDLEMANIKERYMGFKMGIEENGLPWMSEFIIHDKRLRLNKLVNSKELMNEYLADKRKLPEVFLTTSDLIAIGTMSSLRENGYDIPKDIGIVGFDDITIAAHAYPPLTTVAQNMKLLGKSCFMKLLDSIEGRDTANSQMVINAKIIIRESVKI